MAKHAKTDQEFNEEIREDIDNVDQDYDENEPIDIEPESAARGSHVKLHDDEPFDQIVDEHTEDDEFERIDVVDATSNVQIGPVPSEHLRKSRRTRVLLIVAIVVSALVFAGLGCWAYFKVSDAWSSAALEADKAEEKNTTALEGGNTVDAGAASEVTTAVLPKLADVIGLTKDEALKVIGHGAVIASESDILEEVPQEEKEKSAEGEEKSEPEKKVVGSKVTVNLAAEKPDDKGNIPTVYLTLDKDGKVVKADFSCSLSSLGCNDLSFQGVVVDKDIVTVVLNAMGVPVNPQVAQLPAETDYRTVDENDKVTEEKYTFSGQTDTDSASYTWSVRLSYDYSRANLSNNLSDTIKLIYVCIEA